MTLIYCIPPRASLKRRPHSTIGFVLLAPNISKLVIEKRVTTFRSAAILFDLDGVLVDSTGSVDRQWRLWARERGIAEEKVIAIAHGVRAEAEVRALEKREAADRDGVAVMPGAVDLVHRIPEGLWCVVTSGSRYLATGRLRLAGIPVPQVMVTADDVVNGKPHPEPYLKGAELLKVDPKECLVIEDAPAGIVSAHAAGMKVLALTSTYAASALSSADAVIVKLDQIQVAADGTRKLTIEIDET
jgi:sugar-phosphatase